MPDPVLLVDDDAEFRQLATGLLQSWGHEVVTAADGREALEQARARKPRIVLADVGLPDGDGFTLTRRLRDQTPGLPVILLSSDDHAGAGGAVERSGAMAFFPKDELTAPALRQLLADG